MTRTTVPPKKASALSEFSTVSRPKQARSEETLLRLLDAGQTLIMQKGLADTSIPEIVRKANSSVGGFYARFRDKDELLRALEERFMADIGDRLDTLTRVEDWEDSSLADVMRACVTMLVDVYRERHALILAFIGRASQDQTIWRGGLLLRRRVSDQIGRLFVAHAHEISHPDPERAVSVAVSIALGVMMQKVIFSEVRAHGRELSYGEIGDELVRAVMGYLGVREATPKNEPKDESDVREATPSETDSENEPSK